jgi:hypothetical protein
MACSNHKKASPSPDQFKSIVKSCLLGLVEGRVYVQIRDIPPAEVVVLANHS